MGRRTWQLRQRRPQLAFGAPIVLLGAEQNLLIVSPPSSPSTAVCNFRCSFSVRRNFGDSIYTEASHCGELSPFSSCFFTVEPLPSKRGVSWISSMCTGRTHPTYSSRRNLHLASKRSLYGSTVNVRRYLTRLTRNDQYLGTYAEPGFAFVLASASRKGGAKDTKKAINAKDKLDPSRQVAIVETESQRIARERLEAELDALGEELLSVEKILVDLDEVIQRTGNDPKYQSLQTKLRKQAAAIEESKSRLETDLEALHIRKKESVASVAQPVQGIEVGLDEQGTEGESKKASATSKSTVKRTIAELWTQLGSAVPVGTESDNGAQGESYLVLEAELEALEDRLKAVTKLRREIEQKEIQSIEKALDPKSVSDARQNGALEALKQELQDDVKIKERLDDEVANIADQVERLRERMLRLSSTPQGSSGATAGADSVISLDVNALKRTFETSKKKLKDGGLFYVRGLKLFGADFEVSVRMVKSSAAGRPLSERELKHIRRFGMDLLAMIPFTILLAIPISPVGHVLLFGLIQKYVPALMPSTFQPDRVRVMERLEARRALASSTSPPPPPSASVSASTSPRDSPEMPSPSHTENESISSTSADGSGPSAISDRPDLSHNAESVSNDSGAV